MFGEVVCVLGCVFGLAVSGVLNLCNCLESVFVMMLMTTGSLPVLSAAGRGRLEEDMLMAESRCERK